MTKNFLQENLFTLSGMTLADAERELREVLPGRAYKAVPGASNLTDIDPSYLTMKMNEIFGMCGIGWRYWYDPETVNVRAEQRTSRNGREYTAYVANVGYLSLQVRYVFNGELHWSEGIPSIGGSDNEVESYALRGALTNAIGSAASKLSWQLPVYQGFVDHTNAERIYKTRQEKKNSTPVEKSAEENPPATSEPKEVGYTEPTPEPVTEPTPEPKLEKPVLGTKKNGKPKTQPTAGPAPETATVTATVTEVDVAWARTLNILPEAGVPLAGMTLGDAMNDPLGKRVIGYLSGEVARPSDGTFFTPEAGTPLADLKKGAGILLATMG